MVQEGLRRPGRAAAHRRAWWRPDRRPGRQFL